MKLSPSLALSTAFFYALGYPIGALAVRAATPGVVLRSRFVASAVILASIAAALRLEWPRGRFAVHAAVVGVLTQGVHFVGCYQAMRLGVSPVLVALIIAMNPVLTAALATRTLGERLDRRRVASVVPPASWGSGGAAPGARRSRAATGGPPAAKAGARALVSPRRFPRSRTSS